jgi:hypothetical protein
MTLQMSVCGNKVKLLYFCYCFYTDMHYIFISHLQESVFSGVIQTTFQIVFNQTYNMHKNWI